MNRGPSLASVADGSDQAMFAEVWLVDFEFHQPDGELPTPICMVAREFHGGRTLRLWHDELLDRQEAPFPFGPQSLMVAYYASAELSCFLALAWPLPARVLDLYAEFRRVTSGLSTPCGNGLLGALAHFGIDGIDTAEKGAMRDLAQRGGPYTDAERRALLDYCETDVVALAKLLPALWPKINVSRHGDVGRALLRGRYMAAAARMEGFGAPIDTAALTRLRRHWPKIKRRLIAAVDADFGVFVPVGEQMRFSEARFAGWLTKTGIPWPRLESGDLDLKDDTFRDMARAYPAVAPLRELRHTLSELRLESLAVGVDGRNRCLLSAFGSKTGRNQPSNARFIFGPSVWLRGLIRPAEGMALAYIDWEQQEFGIAAALSGDAAMQAAYTSGDPYLTFAKQAGAVPADATKATHGPQRELFKACVLAVQYGMGEKSLALRIGQSEAHARELLRLHRETYPTFWRWSQAAVDWAMTRGQLFTAFDWRVYVGPQANGRSLQNFPMQANGAEMLRLACCLATEQGIRVCAPVHDALLVESPADSLETVVANTQAAMREASAIVLNGFELRTDAKIVRYPDRYTDVRGVAMWDKVWSIVAELEAEAMAVGGNDLTACPPIGPVAPRSTTCCAGATLPVAP